MSADRINKLRAGLAAQNLIEGLGGVRIEDDVVVTAKTQRTQSLCDLCVLVVKLRAFFRRNALAEQR